MLCAFYTIAGKDDKFLENTDEEAKTFLKLSEHALVPDIYRVRKS